MFEDRQTAVGDHFHVSAPRVVHQKAHTPTFGLASRVLDPVRTKYGEAVQVYGTVRIVRC